MRKILSIQKKIEMFLVYIAGICIIVMMFLITLEVITRKLFNISIAGNYEIASLLMVGVGLLGAAYIQAEKEHISVDLFVKFLPQKVVKVTDTLVFIVGFIIASIFTSQAFFKLIESIQMNEASLGLIAIPFWPGRLVVFLSFLMLALRFFTDVLSVITNTERKEKTEQQAIVPIKIIE